MPAVDDHNLVAEIIRPLGIGSLRNSLPTEIYEYESVCF